MRLDLFLAANGLTKSRTKAIELIKNGLAKVNGIVVTRPSFEVDGSESIEAVSENGFASRAGFKLSFALSYFSVSPKGLTVLDIGASTGGFTDCLLRGGARRVYALDVGSMQLEETLKNDPRVAVMENFNARYAKKVDFPEKIDMITMDVSFISQSLIYPACADILGDKSIMITLIKPQFEAGRERIGKGGIVRDPSGRIFAEIREKLARAAYENGFALEGTVPSPIAGGDGNGEYLALFTKHEMS